MAQHGDQTPCPKGEPSQSASPLPYRGGPHPPLEPRVYGRDGPQHAIVTKEAGHLLPAGAHDRVLDKLSCPPPRSAGDECQQPCSANFGRLHVAFYRRRHEGSQGTQFPAADRAGRTDAGIP